MANRFDFFFRQLVTEAELDAALDEIESAIFRVMADNALFGVVANGDVVEHLPTPDLTVDVSGPFLCYDQTGQRIAFVSPVQIVDASVDENGASTSVPTPGNERTLSLFAEFDRLLADPRVDGNSVTVFYQRFESFSLNIAQGAEAAAGTSVPPPLRPDQVLLADIVIANGQTQIFNADIDAVTRRQDMFVLTGTLGVRNGLLPDALQAILDHVNTAASAAGTQYAGGPNWADGTANPAATVEDQLDKMIADIASISTPDSGIRRIGIDGIPASDIVGFAGGVIGDMISQGTLRGAVLDMLGFSAVGTHKFTAEDIPALVSSAVWTRNTNSVGTTNVNGNEIRFPLGFLLHPTTNNGQFLVVNVRAYVSDTAGTSLIQVQLFSSSVRDGSARTSEIASQQSNGSGTAQVLTLASAVGRPWPTNRQLVVVISTTGGGLGTRTLFGLEIDVAYEQ